MSDVLVFLQCTAVGYNVFLSSARYAFAFLRASSSVPHPAVSSECANVAVAHFIASTACMEKPQVDLSA